MFRCVITVFLVFAIIDFNILFDDVKVDDEVMIISLLKCGFCRCRPMPALIPLRVEADNGSPSADRTSE